MNIKDFIVEPHPDDYNGFENLSIIQYNHDKFNLVIIDNVFKDKKEVFVNFLDLTNIDDQISYQLLSQWEQKEPISIFCDKHQFTPFISQHWKRLNSKMIYRIIGPVYQFEMQKQKIRKRKIIHNQTRLSSFEDYFSWD